jgi:hypothetical protein
MALGWTLRSRQELEQEQEEGAGAPPHSAKHHTCSGALSLGGGKVLITSALSESVSAGEEERHPFPSTDFDCAPDT